MQAKTPAKGRFGLRLGVSARTGPTAHRAGVEYNEYQASSHSILGPGPGVSSNSYIRSANRDRRDADCCLAQQMDLLIKNQSWQHHLYLKSILRFFRVGRTYRIIHVSVNSYIRSAYRAPRDADVVLFNKMDLLIRNKTSQRHL